MTDRKLFLLIFGAIVSAFMVICVGSCVNQKLDEVDQMKRDPAGYYFGR